MLENTYRIHFLDKSIAFTTDKIFIWSVFSAGVLLAIISNIEYNINKSIEYVTKNFEPFFDSGSDALTAFEMILLQLNIEFIFVFIAFIASYTVIPKTSYGIVTAVKGYQTATTIKIAFSPNLVTSIFTKIIASAFWISLSTVFIKYIIVLINSINNTDFVTKKNEISLIFSSQSCTRLYSALTTCGSMILLNLLKTILLTTISLF